jgi:DHA1 family tetracycline resistance protein-like MFS transporter
MKKKHLIITITLMATIVIDVMGWGLVFPVMPSLFSHDHSSIVPANLSDSWRHFYYGLAMAAWPLGLFFGGPYLGDLSDKLGRKPVILICLAGVMTTNFLAAITIHYKCLALFVLVRLIMGFFGGSFAIAQAMMIDISNSENKARYISMVTLAASSGFVIGPLITSASTLPALKAVFDYTAPFYIAGAISLINCVFAYYFLPQTEAARKQGHVSLLRGFSVIHEVFADARTQKLMAAFILIFLGWGFYCINLALLVQDVFHYSTSLTALLFAFTAVSNVIGITIFQPIMLRSFSLKQCCLITTLALGALVLLSANTQWAGMQWIIGILAPGIQMIFYTAAMTLLSNSVGPEEQGKAMGGADAGFSLSFMLNSLAIGLLVDIHILLPLILGSACIFIGAIFFTNLVKLPEKTYEH